MTAWLETLRAAWRWLDDVSPWWRMLALLAAFSAVLAGMIWQQQQRLAHGREVILRVQPFDPRDLLRGHYAMLQFDISRIPLAAFAGAGAQEAASLRGREIYAVLRKEPGTPFWTLARALGKRPDALAAGEVALKGRVRRVVGDAVWVEYGVERYYAPKERAQALERLVQGRWRFDSSRGRMVPVEGAMPPGVILKVDREGNAVIAGWLIDGKRRLEETLF